MKDIQMVEHSIKESAYAILKSGQELLPVVFALRQGIEVYSIGHIPKHAWREAIWLLTHVPSKTHALVPRKNEPKDSARVVAFACSMRTRVLAPGEKPQTSPMDDPKADDGAFIVLSSPEELRVWECKYELNSKGEPVNITEWELMSTSEEFSIPFLDGLWD